MFDTSTAPCEALPTAVADYAQALRTGDVGQVVARVQPSTVVYAMEGAEIAVSATVNRTLSHLKAMAPGTDVVRHRQPATYAALTAQGALAHP